MLSRCLQTAASFYWHEHDAEAQRTKPVAVEGHAYQRTAGSHAGACVALHHCCNRELEGTRGALYQSEPTLLVLARWRKHVLLAQSTSSHGKTCAGAWCLLLCVCSNNPALSRNGAKNANGRR